MTQLVMRAVHFDRALSPVEQDVVLAALGYEDCLSPERLLAVKQWKFMHAHRMNWWRRLWAAIEILLWRMAKKRRY